MYLKNSLNNLFYGFISQIITIALGIIIPRIFLLNFGSELNGLISSLQQIFMYLTLLEGGIGAASLQALYSPIANESKDKINSILSATNKYYKKTGYIYIIVVLILAIIYPIMMKTQISKMKIFLLILIMGMSGVISYFSQAKFNLFLRAAGKGYVIINLATICSILTSFSKIIMLNLRLDIVCIQLIYLCISIIQMLYIQWYIKRNYSWIDINIKPDYEAISQKNSALVHQISTLVFNNTDILLLTFFCNLKVVSIYTMYSMLFGMAQTLFSTINSSVVFVLGQTYHKGKKYFIKIYDIYELYITTIAFIIYGVAYIFILPFLKLYTEGIGDINYIDNLLAILFLLSNLLPTLRLPASNIISIAGHFKETKSRSIIETTINIIFSIIFVNIFGIYGVLLGTIIALLYRTNDMIIYFNKKILGRKLIKSYRTILINSILLFFSIKIFNNISVSLTSYVEIILMAMFVGVVMLVVFIIVMILIDINLSKEIYCNIKKYIVDKKKNNACN